MAYRMPCNEPDFRQSVPEGEWTLVPDPLFPACFRYRNAEGETVLVPAIWYNALPKSYAASLRHSAEEADRRGAFHEADTKPWSRGEAERARRRAASMRKAADLYEASAASTAGHARASVEQAMVPADFAIGDRVCDRDGYAGTVRRVHRHDGSVWYDIHFQSGLAVRFPSDLSPA